MGTNRKPLIKTDSWASSIGRNDDNKRVSVCPECQGQVVWCESKSGKFYLADAYNHHTTSGKTRLVYNAGFPHFKTCGQKIERRQLLVKREELTAAWRVANAAGDVDEMLRINEEQIQLNKEINSL